MNPQEASHILGVPENASEAEIKDKFNELYNDYQIRLTNAPTPNLKKLYQKNIEELNEAYNAMSKAFTHTDLPSSSPVFNNPQSKRFSEEPTAEKKPVAVESATKPSAPAQQRDEKPKSNSLLSVFIAVIIVATAGSAFLGFKLGSAPKSNGDESVSKTLDSLSKICSRYTNGKFKIQNAGSDPLTIKKIIVTYNADNGELKKYFANVNKTIAPGAVDSLAVVEGNQVVWDGSVLTYYMQIDYKGETNHWSGLWTKDATGKNGIFIINP
jgi:hypothetical protein